MVINSHLHFDHAGGNTIRGPDGVIRPTFPNARYVMQRGEYEYATHTNERTAASYFPHNFEPVAESGPARADRRRPRDRPRHSLRVDAGPHAAPSGSADRIGGELAFYIADLAPTSAHLPLPWIMGYDVEPLVTLETKRRILKRAVDEKWLVVFEHDPTTAWSRLAHDGKTYGLASA